MSFKTKVARLAGQRRPRAVSRTAKRRFTRVPVVVTAVCAAVAAITLVAGPARAATGQYSGMGMLQNAGAIDLNTFSNICMDADSGQASDFGKIVQWDCNGYDSYQAWNFVYAGNGTYQLQSVGTNMCADADAANVEPGGKIIQWTCNASDPYQLFYITDMGNGSLSIKSLGATNAAGTPMCLDADYWTEGVWGAIQQYPCDTSDSYQIWYIEPSDLSPK